MKIALVYGMKMFSGEPLRRMIDIARVADGLGFDYLCLAEHVLMHGHAVGASGMHPPDELMPEPLTTLAAFAGATERIGLMTGILIAPLRPAGLLAKTAATLHALAGGRRVVLGVSTSWQAEEYAALDVPFQQRGQQAVRWTAPARRRHRQPFGEQVRPFAAEDACQPRGGRSAHRRPGVIRCGRRRLGMPGHPPRTARDRHDRGPVEQHGRRIRGETRRPRGRRRLPFGTYESGGDQLMPFARPGQPRRRLPRRLFRRLFLHKRNNNPYTERMVELRAAQGRAISRGLVWKNRDFPSTPGQSRGWLIWFRPQAMCPSGTSRVISAPAQT